MEWDTLRQKSLNDQRARVDRFVAPRSAFPELRRRMAWGLSDARAVDCWCHKDLQRKKYITYLDDAFGLEPLNTGATSETGKPRLFSGWPCIPRKRGYLSNADSVLDLPNYSNAAFPELLDWGSDNILVAALGRNYHKWSWRTQSVISLGLAQSDIQCCRFDPQGELLALGTGFRHVEVHDNLLNKWISSNYCRCGHAGEQYCSITALAWSPTGNSFVTGCSRGVLVSFDRSNRPIHWRMVAAGPLHVVRVSPNARYVAAAAINYDAVMLFTWPELEDVTTLGINWAVKTLCWHPWRSALLGIGITVGHMARILLWDAGSDKIQQETLGSPGSILDVMLFSHRTGEMVLSMWNADPENSYQRLGSYLMVLSGPHTVVDHYGEEKNSLDRIRTMIFSPDGTKLATATAEEDLIIWNFLPEDKDKKKKTNSRRFSDLPVYLDKASHGYSLR